MADEWARARKAAEQAEKDAAKVAADTNAAREQRRVDFAESDQGHTSAQIAEAERLMRLPTPETLKETGAVLQDPTRFPGD